MKKQELIKWINKQDYLCLDTETRGKYLGLLDDREGLDPYLSKLISVQIGNSERQEIIFGVPDKDIMEAISKKLCIGHNIKFDYKILYVETGIRLEKVYDTMIGESLLNNSSSFISYSLNDVLERLFGLTMNKDIRSSFVDTIIMSEEQINYALEDIKHLERLALSQLKRCKGKSMHLLFELEMQVVKAIAEMELNGLYLNEEDWEKVYEDNLKRRDVIQHKLEACLWKEKKYQFFDIIKKQCQINWNSTKQVIPVFESFNFDISSSENKSGISIAEKNIIKYKEHEFVQLYLDFKGVGKSISTYGINFIEKYKNPITGRYHTNLKQNVSTGRVSSSAPNVQNIPVGDLRACWNFKNKPNSMYLVCDYSKQELCVLADRANEQSLIDTLNAEDAHAETAKKIFKNKYAREKHRPIGKMVNFAVAYGSTAHNLSERLKVSLQEAQSYIDSFYEAYPNLMPYFDKIYQKALKDRYILLDEVTNRKFYINSYMRADEIRRKCQNYPIQSLSATITKEALVRLYEFTIKDDRVKLLSQVHDEIILEVVADYDEIENKVVNIMMEAASKYISKIQLKVGSLTSKYWDH